MFSTDSETKSNASRRGEIIYGDVSDVGGASASPEGKDMNEPPPANGKHLIVQNQIRRLLRFRQRRAKRLKK